MASSDRTSRRSAIPRGRHAPPLEVRLNLQRERLFEAAAAVFAETGYADASAESISRAAGMSKATFYEHFANKEECIIALFDYAWDVLIARIVQAATAAGDDPLQRQREGMRAFLMALVEFPNEAQTLLVEIIGAGPAAARRRDEILERFARVVDRENERMARTTGHAALRLARRRLRDRRRDRRAGLAPGAARPAGPPARPAAGDRALRDRPARRRSCRRRRERRPPPASRTLTAEIVDCRRCPRLVAWREEVATVKRAAFRDQEYWGRPAPGFGDPDARVLVLGLAPAAHGANRTGRIFTGDRSGDWLFAALWRCGLANQPTSVSRDDGLALHGAYVTAAVRCAPPANKPLPAERDTCSPYLERELRLLRDVDTIVCLGGFAWEAALRLRAALGDPIPRPKPRFGHGAELLGERWRADRLLPPEPAEHLHRPPDRADDRRRPPARPRAGRPRRADPR